MQFICEPRKARPLPPVLLLAASLVMFGPSTLQAQVPTTPLPTTSQAKTLLETRSDLVEQLRTRLLASGMSPEQVRARLKALGYPENLLDRYIPGSTETAPTPPGTDVLEAAKALGLGEVAPGPVTIPRPVQETPAVKDTVIVRAAGDTAMGLKVFGIDVFQRTTNQFDPSDAGAADANYRVGPRDALVLILTGDVEAAYPLEVTREGFVVVPRVGQVYVANLTLAQISEVFFSRLQRVYSSIGRSPNSRIRYSVSVSRIRTNQIFVLGNAVAPAGYQISGLGTAMTALYAAGGPSRTGGMRDIEVRRGGAAVGHLDLYEYLLQGNSANDVRLENGDIVFVPFRGKRVILAGAVGRPAIYEMRQGESLADLIRFGGGLDATAAHDRVQISRVLPPAQRAPGGRERVVIDVPLDSARGAVPAYELADNDNVFVFSIGDRIRNRIAVTGSVWTPGSQGLAPGMRLSGALRAAGGVRPDAYLGEVLISRRQPDETRVRLRTSLLDRTGRVAEDLPLQEDDKIQVFSAAEFRNVRNVTVAGPVKKAGEFDYYQGMTLRDLVLMAGNFPDSTDVYEDVLVSRLQGDMTRSLIRQRVRDASGGIAVLPLLPGDSVTLFSLSQFRTPKTVEILGMVRKPGRYNYSAGLRLRDLVQLAGGLQDGAYLQRAEIARVPAVRTDGNLADTLSVPLDSTYLFDLTAEGTVVGRPGFNPPARIAPEVPLEALDNVLILKQPNFQLPQTVVIAGEVRFPGAYTLQRKGERLSEVVKRAGGLTLEAYAGGAQFTRRDDRIGRIDIDLERLLKRPGSLEDYALLPGDSLNVPPYIPTVKIVGAVNSPTSVTYKAGQGILYYVDAAGGATELGDEKRSYVFQPNGKIESYRAKMFWPDEVPHPKAGAVVTVPAKEKNEGNWSTIITPLAQVLGGVLTLLVVVLRK